MNIKKISLLILVFMVNTGVFCACRKKPKIKELKQSIAFVQEVFPDKGLIRVRVNQYEDGFLVPKHYLFKKKKLSQQVTRGSWLVVKGEWGPGNFNSRFLINGHIHVIPKKQQLLHGCVYKAILTPYKSKIYEKAVVVLVQLGGYSYYIVGFPVGDIKNVDLKPKMPVLVRIRRGGRANIEKVLEEYDLLKERTTFVKEEILEGDPEEAEVEEVKKAEVRIRPTCKKIKVFPWMK